ncbi:MAG: Mechanosensitive ion channel-domain-containing protein [Linnemannia gamsii]|nr:MAG: Mechanosensitive ion channel-domain-containing protein [Linnemannia gamsii]
MNSDESDFDWDEDINIDDDDTNNNSSSNNDAKKKKKKRSTWRQLAPFLRMLILIITVAPIVALPAGLTGIFLKTDDDPQNQDRRCGGRDLWVAAFMWCIICINNWVIDLIPAAAVMVCSWIAPTKVETLKSRLLIFVGTKKYIKWFIDACWALAAFVVLSSLVYPLVALQVWQSLVIRILVSVLILAGLVLLEKVILHKISKNFHQIAYADRIQENKYALAVLDRLGTSRRRDKREGPFHGCRRYHSQHLHVPRPTMTPHTTTVLQANTSSHSHRKTQRDIFQGLNRKLHVLARADTNPSKDINSTENAKRLARSLFHNLQHSPLAEQLTPPDFYPYFSTPEDAQKAFTLFDKDGNGDISKREMKEKIFYVYKERKDLHTALRDLSQAVGKLDIIFLTIVFIVWLIAILSIFGASVVQNMLSIGSFLVALSFVFGNSLRTLFENIVFLFITHPYDSGDLCDIDGTFMYVREVGLNSTMFVTWDGRRIYYPNNILSQKAIKNIRRSPNMTDKIVVHIDVYTSQEKIFDLRARMRDFLAMESKEFSPDIEIQIQEIDVRLKISMCIEHKGNWQDSARRWARRTKFHYALKEAIEDLGIKYHHIPERISLVQSEGLSALLSSSSTSYHKAHYHPHRESLDSTDALPFHLGQPYNHTDTGAASSPAVAGYAARGQVGGGKGGGQASRMMVEGEMEREVVEGFSDSDRDLHSTMQRSLQRRRSRRMAHDAGGGGD